MKQNPNNLKFKKFHKLSKFNLSLDEQKVFFPNFSPFAIKSLGFSNLTLKQIEACRKSVRRNVKKGGNVILRVFTYHSITSKSLGSRMGKGKGNHSFWVCPIKRGQIICELSGFSKLLSTIALKSASTKLPFKCKVIKLFY